MALRERLTIVQFGVGRIGVIHARNVAAHPRARLKYLVSPHADNVEETLSATGATLAEADAALADPAVDAVIVASPTDTHCDLIERSVTAGKAVLCEKPIDLDMARVDACLKVVARHGVPVMLGFNRRFDPSFLALKARLDAGAIGRVELVQITSRDPAPPPAAFIRSSGGLFRDMTIHDFDMARWLLGEDPVEVYAAASVLVDSAIGEAGDVDTAIISLKTGSGALCQITNSRRASYGYDQRIEVHGDGGMLQAGNRTATSLVEAAANGVITDRPLAFFLERYTEAYAAELAHFIDAVLTGTAPSPDGADGRKALALADAAEESLRTGGPVRLPSLARG